MPKETEVKTETETDVKEDVKSETKAKVKKEEKKEVDPALTALEAEKAELAERLAKYELLEKEKEEAKKSLEQKQAEQAIELNNLKKQNLIQSVRLTHGFTDAVFNGLTISGETESEIKKSFESHKASLDAYVKAQGVVAAPGAGTTTNLGVEKTKGDAKTQVSWLEAKGLVKKAAIV